MKGFHDGTGKLSLISIVHPDFFECLLDLSSAFKLFDASTSYRSPTMFTQVYGYTDSSFLMCIHWISLKVLHPKF